MSDEPRCPYCLGRMRLEVGWRVEEPMETYVWWRCLLDHTHITAAHEVCMEPGS